MSSVFLCCVSGPIFSSPQFPSPSVSQEGKMSIFSRLRRSKVRENSFFTLPNVGGIRIWELVPGKRSFVRTCFVRTFVLFSPLPLDCSPLRIDLGSRSAPPLHFLLVSIQDSLAPSICGAYGPYVRSFASSSVFASESLESSVRSFQVFPSYFRTCKSQYSIIPPSSPSIPLLRLSGGPASP